MAITRLKRKGRKNKKTAAVRRSSIKQLTSKPVIKNVDIEEIKKGFKTSTKEAKPKKEVKEAPKAEEVKEVPKAEVVKEEKVAKKPVAKKAAPKKEA